MKKAGDCFPFQVVFLGSLLQKLTGSSWKWKNIATNFSSLSAGGEKKSYLVFRIHLCQGRVGQLRNAESPLHGTLFCRKWSPPVVFIPLPLAPGYLFMRNFNPDWWGRWILFGCGLWCDLCQIVEVLFWEVQEVVTCGQLSGHWPGYTHMGMSWTWANCQLLELTYTEHQGSSVCDN